jgi:ABC-type antimicrobial peptide transport system permease subunit
MTLAIWGYQPDMTIPWDWVGMGVAFTMGVCLIAGVLPARHAARSNILEALQTT